MLQFELSELKLFNEAGVNVAPQADAVELLIQPSNPQDIAMINDELYWGSGGHFVSWENQHGFHGQDLVRLTFRTPQAITGAELYSTNYESFGTDSVIIADGATSIPVRMVFLGEYKSNLQQMHGKMPGRSLTSCVCLQRTIATTRAVRTVLPAGRWSCARARRWRGRYLSLMRHSASLWRLLLAVAEQNETVLHCSFPVDNRK